MPTRKTLMWWWIIPLILLIAWVNIPRLGYDAFSGDELRSVIVAGGAHHGPLSWPNGVWDRVAFRSPDQALGFPLVIWWWGNAVGWEEMPLRTISLLAGVLALAMLYRVGSDLFHPFVGISAVTIMGVSIYFTTYLHKFRVFTIAALCITLMLWCYWRMTISPGRAKWGAYVGFVASGIGLLYTHYFFTPFLAVIGLYHLLFAPKTRRWWIPVILAVPVSLSFIPEVSVLIKGFAKNRERVDLHATALSPVGIVRELAEFFSNGYWWFFVAAVIVAVAAFVRLPKDSGSERAALLRRNLIYLWFAALAFLAGIMALNEVAEVFVERRVRYMMGMWPLVALIVATGLWWLSTRQRYLGVGMLVIWAALGAQVTLADTMMTFGTGDQRPVPPWREMADLIRSQGEPDDGVIYFGDDIVQFGHYTHGMNRRTIVPPYWGDDIMYEGIEGVVRLWYGINVDENQDENLARFAEILDEAGFEYCENVMSADLLTMDLYTTSPAFCPGGEPMIQFGDYLTLMQMEEVRTDTQLILNTGWATSAAIPVNTYSIGFQVLDADTGELVAQRDIGLGVNDGPYTPVQASFDLSELPAGRYDVMVLAYDWQTGVRLTGTDVRSDEQSATGMVLLDTLDM